MKMALVFVFLGVLLATVLSWGGSVKGSEYDTGKNLFEEKCQICHGANGKGDGPAAPALNPSPKDFTKPKFWQDETDKKITDTVRKGHPPMPAFDLKDDEIRAIIDYMRHAFKKT